LIELQHLWPLRADCSSATNPEVPLADRPAFAGRSRLRRRPLAGDLATRDT
jgi:hypothetical protein